MIDFEQWEGFEGRIWKEEVNVRDFIQKNYTPYDGDESFLAGPTEATDKLWGALQKLQKAERAKGGVLDMETEVVSGLTAYGPGYIDESLKDLEQIVGLQTDKPLKRAFMPYGGIKMAEQACTTYGYQPSEELHKIFTDYTRTHNQAVFDAYTPEMKTARHTHIITGLPDTYGRGRIVGDYRRVALYGIDALIKFKQEDFANCGDGTMTDDVIRLREESQLLREYCAQIQNMFQAEIGIRQNHIMQILTIVTTIFLPLSLLVGWYGMNFQGMPELSWKYGYPAVIGVSVLFLLLSLWLCKKKKFW